MPTKYRIATSEVNYFGRPLRDYWYELRYHQLQNEAYRTGRRFIGLDCGRGSGKTELARRRIIRFLPVKCPWPNPLYFYALPTYAQARRVAWEPLLNLIPKGWLAGKPSESRMEIKTVFGSTLYVVGMDKPERVEGLQYDGCVVDESCDQKPGHYERTIMPALTHRNGWCWRIGVPKRAGPGSSDFKEYCEKHRFGEDKDHRAYTWPSETVLNEDQLDALRNSLSEQDYEEQVGANWQQVGGTIYHSFGEHNIEPCHYDPSKIVIVGSDFNVNPMCWTLSHLDVNKLRTFDEIFLRNTNTRNTLDHLYNRYGSHSAGWLFLGDATARARKTSASASDYYQIQNDDRFINKKVRYLKANPLQSDRFASCNALFKNAKGEVRYFVDPSVKRLIRDLTGRVFKEGTKEPNDGGDMGHMSDGIGYVIHGIFPIRIDYKGPAPEVVTCQ